MATVRPWPPRRLLLLESQLDQLAGAVKDTSTRSDADQVWLSRFLLVRACGFLEQVVHETIVEHLRQRSGGTARAFALSWMTRSRTPSPENLYNLLNRLDQSMEDQLRELMNDDDGHYYRELSMLVHRRHQIAHGLNEGLGTKKVLELVDLVKLLSDWFIRRLDPTWSAAS